MSRQMPGNERFSTVLVLGSFHTSIAVVRLLAQAGYRVIVERRRNDPSFADRSRDASEVWEHPGLEHDDDLIDALRSFLSERPDVSVVFPILDNELLPVARHFDELSRIVRLAMPGPQVIDICENKIKLMRLASRIGIPQTPYALVSDATELFLEADRIGYPCVVKPPDSQALLVGKKALILPDASALRTAFSSWPEAHPSLIVQGFAFGQRYDMYVMARRGQILRALQTKVFRTDRANGTGITVDAITVEPSRQLIQQCESLAAELDLTGPAYFQFHCDEERGSSHLLEINPRLGVNFAITAHCGLNLPDLTVRLALGEEIPVPEDRYSYPLGRRYAWTYGDLSGLKRDLGSGEIGAREAVAWLGKLLVTCLRADMHVTWSWKDPLPTLSTFWHPIAKRAAAVLRPPARAALRSRGKQR